MARVWLTCALGTAVIVALALVFKNRPDTDAQAKGPEAPSPLSEEEVRLYIQIMPRIDEICRNMVPLFQRERVQNKGHVDAEAYGVLPQVEALLERHHLTLEDWDRLSKRVEYAVNTIRAAAELERSRTDIEEQVKMKKALLPALAQEDQRKDIEKEIGQLEALLSGEGPPLSDQDRELMRRYWRALDAATPRVGPPPKPQPPQEPGTPPDGR